MCGRYALHAHPDVVALQFGLAEPPSFQPRYNISPGGEILVVRVAQNARVAQACRWGLVPHWAKDPSIGNKLANARAETLDEKPAFRDAFRRWRCLVPASGYYEWKTVAGMKQPWYLAPTAGELFALAGLTALWHGPQRRVRSVSLITTAANELTASIHDRMPVIVAPEDYEAWLDPSNTGLGSLKRMVHPYPAQRMRAHAVSPRVNKPDLDDAALLAPLPEGPLQPDLL
jgi:putative SOS response-associated peptidase YedK